MSTRMTPEREAEIREYVDSIPWKQVSQTYSRYADLLAEIDALRKELKIEELKNRNSLARNLCPDHRDKQNGRPWSELE